MYGIIYDLGHTGYIYVHFLCFCFPLLIDGSTLGEGRGRRRVTSGKHFFLNHDSGVGKVIGRTAETIDHDHKQLRRSFLRIGLFECLSVFYRNWSSFIQVKPLSD